jgi:predicted dehydrogenase
MRRLRAGILGAGGIGARHAGAMARLPEQYELVAACGRRREAAEAFAATHGGRAFNSLDEMLDEAALDVLVVALPPYAHAGEVERAAMRGVHLLVEKPIALDLERAHRMVATSEGAGVTAAVGFMYRHGAAVARWRELASAGETGPVGLFAGSYHCNALHAQWWRERGKSGGQLLEQVIHLIDLIRLFMGDPDTVYGRNANLFHGATPGYDSEDVSTIVFGWDDGRVANLHASNIAVPGRWLKEWRVMAERYAGRFDDWNTAVLTRIAPEVADETVAADRDVFVAQLADLAAAISEGRPPLAPLREGEASLRLALAARQAADERREIRLSDAI